MICNSLISSKNLRLAERLPPFCITKQFLRLISIFSFCSRRKTDALILSLDKIYDYANAKGFKFDHEFINIYGWLVQFVEASHNDLWKEAIENADVIKVGSFEVSLIGREHLVAMWLFAEGLKTLRKSVSFGKQTFWKKANYPIFCNGTN